MAEDTNEQSDCSSGRLVESLCLLRRIRDWDHLSLAADGGYWIREIDSMLNNNREGAAHRLERMRDALIRIMVWADQDVMSGESRQKAMADIAKACRDGLHE